MNIDVFTYQNFFLEDDRQTVNFTYKLTKDDNEYSFTESLKFPIALPDSTQIMASLRALHLALGISYYKIFVNQHIKHPYEMEQEEADFWNEVWANGLGEFLYVNKLPISKLAKFKPQTGKLIKDVFTPFSPNNGAILGVGGGKDSIVAGEILKSAGVELSGFVMATGEQLGQSQSVANTMGIDLRVIERRLDRELLQVQELPGAYKGHIPISLIFGLVGTALALATNSNHVVVANESSSSIPRITWEDRPVNHQWSKSFEFEKMLQKFIKNFISDSVTYFSAIRPLTSVAVAKIFATYSQYFEIFTSDNYVFRIKPENRPNQRWSIESPKSLSSYILLSPWMAEEDLKITFGRDFLNEHDLENLFSELIGHKGHPPLDCVGTVEELVLSLNLSFSQGKHTKSALVRRAIEWGVINDKNDWQAELNKMLELSTDEQAYPASLADVITNEIKGKLS